MFFPNGTKRVTVRVVGGLGNQLHCYAFGRAVSAHSHAVLEVDAVSGYWNDPFQRQYLLDEFPALDVKKKTMAVTDSARRVFKIEQKIYDTVSRILPLPIKLVVREGYSHYQENVHRTKYITSPYFLGYWASYKYYGDVEADLRQELRPPIPTHPSVLKLLSQIQSVQSCFIHWRSYEEDVDVEHPSLRSYYREAMETISAQYPGITFFVFSDNPATAREEIAPSHGQVVFVDLPTTRGNIQSLGDFYLMYMCNHAIIGDSTFSWWAAWLDDQEGKTIIAPRGLSPWGEDWLPPHWISLDANRCKDRHA